VRASNWRRRVAILRRTSERRPLARRAVSIARREGLPGIVRAVARSLVWVRRFLLLELALDGGGEPAPPPGIVVRLLGENELRGIARADLRGLLERRLRLGDEVLVAWLNGRVAGWIWLARSVGADPDRIPVRLAPGELFGDGLMVLPDVRRRGVATALLLARNARARADGAEAVVSLARRSNAPVLALQRRFGARIRAKLLVVQVLGRFRLLSERASPAGAVALPPPRSPGGSASCRGDSRSRR
jgi:GNAT superfamily N-acetyltransferase